jgi:hypothetical protein
VSPTTAPRVGADVIAGAAAAAVGTITDCATEVGCGNADHADGSAVGGEEPISAAGGV